MGKPEDDTMPAKNAVDNADPAAKPRSKAKTAKKKKEPEMNPKFKDVEETGKWGDVSKNEVYVAAGVVLLVVIGVAVGVGVAVSNSDGDTIEKEAKRPTSAPSLAPTALDAENELDFILSAIGEYEHTAPYLDFLSTDGDFYDGLMDDPTASPQERAISWMLYEDTNNDLDDLGERFAMASIYYALDGEGWNRTGGWLTSAHLCDWDNINCDLFNQRIDEIDLGDNNLHGTVPNEFAMFNETQAVWLRQNELTGPVPSDVFGAMPKLSFLYLDNNKLTGTISADLIDNGVLDSLFIQRNDITGSWPEEFCVPKPDGLSFTVANFGVDCDKLECTCCIEAVNCYYST